MDFKGVVLLKVIILILAQFSLLEAVNDLLDQTEIVDGLKSRPGSYPYLVALVTTYKGQRFFTCGGILVGLKAVMTAATCIDIVYDETLTPPLDSSLSAVVGTNEWKTGGDVYAISYNVTHPQYAGSPNSYNIGFLFTTTCVQSSLHVWPIPLDFEHVGSGVRTKVAGWGNPEADGEGTVDLYELQMTTINVFTCMVKARHVSNSYKINDNLEICVFNSNSSGACNDDTGAPLIRTDRGSLVGILSWGFACAKGGPDFAIRFSTFKDWILKTLFGEFHINKPTDWKAMSSLSKNKMFWC